MQTRRDLQLRARIVANSRHFEVRGAFAKRSVFFIQPIKELICGVTITIPNHSHGGCWRLLLGCRGSDNQFPILGVVKDSLSSRAALPTVPSFVRVTWSKRNVLSALCGLKVCAFKALIAIDLELEIIDAQKMCKGLVFHLLCFPLFY